MSSPRIGFIGLGDLGTPIAINLISYAKSNNLSPITFWNRTTSKYNSIKEVSSESIFVESPEELVGKCDIVMTVLVNDQAAEDVHGRLVKGVKDVREVIFMDHSTLLPETAKKLQSQAAAHNCTYLTCPVFGQPAAARIRGLTCIVSGEPTAREKVKPILSYIGKSVIDAGDDVTKGSQLKLLGNMTLLSAIQLFGEVYTLAESIGFDPAVLHETYKAFIPAPALLNYSNKLSHGTFGGAGFKVDTGLKDASHIKSLYSNLNPKPPVSTFELAVENLQKAKTDGYGHLDWSALTLLGRKEAGLEIFKEGTNEGKDAPPPM